MKAEHEAKKKPACLIINYCIPGAYCRPGCAKPGQDKRRVKNFYRGARR